MSFNHALHELVKNALQHGAGCVSVWVRADNGQMSVTVRDQGPGFPLDLRRVQAPARWAAITQGGWAWYRGRNGA